MWAGLYEEALLSLNDAIEIRIKNFSEYHPLVAVSIILFESKSSVEKYFLTLFGVLNVCRYHTANLDWYNFH